MLLQLSKMLRRITSESYDTDTKDGYRLVQEDWIAGALHMIKNFHSEGIRVEYSDKERSSIAGTLVRDDIVDIRTTCEMISDEFVGNDVFMPTIKLLIEQIRGLTFRIEEISENGNTKVHSPYIFEKTHKIRSELDIILQRAEYYNDWKTSYRTE